MNRRGGMLDVRAKAAAQEKGNNMNSHGVGLRVASIIFGLACIGQLSRLLLRLEIMIAGRHVPLWLSGFAVVVTAGMCWWLWKISVPAKPAEATGSPAA